MQKILSSVSTAFNENSNQISMLAVQLIFKHCNLIEVTFRSLKTEPHFLSQLEKHMLKSLYLVH